MISEKANNKRQQNLERRILHGLACEWESAVGFLDEKEQKALHRPFFSLSNAQRQWGSWSGSKRELAISRKLVFHYSWESVREVLFHEMAHQMAEEVYGAHGESPHGQMFQKACARLNANPSASGRYRPLEERMASRVPDIEDKVYQRAKKLMALAESANRHEAELAMAKAHELIARHHLEGLRLNEPLDFTSCFLGQPALRHFREEYELAHLLQEFYFVYGIWVSAYVLEKEKMGRVLEISGTVQHIRLASYVYDFVHHFIDAQWEKYNRNKGLNRYRKTDFAEGIIQGFRSKLLSQIRENDGCSATAESSCLIKIRDPLLVKYIARRYPRRRTVSGYISSQDKKVHSDGRQTGKDMVIYKGISEKRCGRQKGVLIP